jgi:hypothetical protein
MTLKKSSKTSKTFKPFWTKTLDKVSLWVNDVMKGSGKKKPKKKGKSPMKKGY